MKSFLLEMSAANKTSFSAAVDNLSSCASPSLLGCWGDLPSAGCKGSLDMLMSASCAGVLLVATFFLNSELVAWTVTALWAAEKVVAGDERATVTDKAVG